MANDIILKETEFYRLMFTKPTNGGLILTTMKNDLEDPNIPIVIELIVEEMGHPFKFVVFDDEIYMVESKQKVFNRVIFQIYTVNDMLQDRIKRLFN